MAQEKLGGMGWILIGVAAYALLMKKTGSQIPFIASQSQLAQAAMLPTTPQVGSDSYTAWAQQSLNKLIGAGLSVDGILGPRTRAAIMQFQGMWGMSQTGIIDPETDYNLRAALGQSPYIDQPYDPRTALSVAGEY